MPLSKANAKINNIINRVVPYGKKDKLEIVDRDTHEVLATVKLWSLKKLNPSQKGETNFLITLAQDPTTAELLPKHVIAINGLVHDIKGRSGPVHTTDTEWILRTAPTNKYTE